MSQCELQAPPPWPRGAVCDLERRRIEIPFELTDTLFRGIEAGESSVSGEERQWQPRPPPDCSASPHGAAPSPRRGALDPAMATDSTLFLWMGLGFGWQREGRGKMEARVAVDPPATGSGSTRSSDGDAMGANHAPDTCDDGSTLDPLPLDLHPSSVGLCGL